MKRLKIAEEQAQHRDHDSTSKYQTSTYTTDDRIKENSWREIKGEDRSECIFIDIAKFQTDHYLINSTSSQ